MTTSESKDQFFYYTIESIRITNRIYLTRELECSNQGMMICSQIYI